ncbi:magnesium transporter CorA family protein [Methanocorpusculum vombati]|uniref:Magnesium transporter CorA family protein n=1 Tax=Methanocorpusculum vombati TaxID=3002864 RepID=A0ABT4IKL3_9EURY|nr:magnesium transporter CorA family protein [Methanocorpusculum vombati]MCZ9319108.1 magnesium transporter CorA family protein [Methanocorpusculum sp.]MCZ0861690.1 magnesium transporter CorA family protein [Methanocorpusculum vombati]MDE2520149.1 magnesium transporter CorA family protein [Methanocorpusculum sp.]MDE2535076.1 magnesium transporter CorA family protein [Methanocorpusculum sp.]MDE2545627.1 magnesium transporter CorA family protein [Methanocorpusculum sp.]
MLEIYRSADAPHGPSKIDTIESGSWIRMIQPTEDEITYVCTTLSIPRDDIITLLDDEESPRIEHDDGRTLIIVDTPYVDDSTDPESRPAKTAGITSYTTVPSGFIVMQDTIITVSLRKNPVLQTFIDGKVKNFSTVKKTRFLLQFLYRNARLFIQHLRQIDDLTNTIEHTLYTATKNEELFEMLRISKSLVYMTTALKANEAVLEKLYRFPTPEVRMYEEDEDLLEDTIIENRQALEMAQTYSSTLGHIMDTCASIINNNVNSIMKLFTVVTILLTIPTMIASFLGMNVLIPDDLSQNPFAFPLLITGSLSISAVLLWLLFRKKII